MDQFGSAISTAKTVRSKYGLFAEINSLVVLLKSGKLREEMSSY